MPRQRASVQINQFIGGLNTEANPLNYPANALIAEENMNLLKDGSRVRRKGFDIEPNAVSTSAESGFVVDAAGVNTFVWENPGGDTTKTFVAVQIGNDLNIHEFTKEGTLSQASLFTNSFSELGPISFAFTSVDNILVIVIGKVQIYNLDYTPSSGTFTLTSDKLRIRDLFGVDDGLSENDRPVNLTDTHLYNLRNQTFSRSVVDGSSNNTNLLDPVAAFYAETLNTAYPSNSDSINRHLVANPEFSSNRTVERFNAQDLVSDGISNSEAPKGYFIIDAVQRGLSRQNQEAALVSKDSNLTLVVAASSLPEDRTNGGARVVGQYAGRVWYAGFPSETIDGDDKSPRMSSYVLFSQVVNSPDQMYKCYQAGSPTSNEDPDIVASDGGFLKIDDANNINGLQPFGTALFVFAENGIWRILGEEGNTFTATSITVDKISDQGCISPRSIIKTDTSILFWGNGSIYAIIQNEVGEWVVEDIARSTIQSFYTDIPVIDRVNSVATYNPDTFKVTWLYGANLSPGGETRELILDLKFQAYQTRRVLNPSGVCGIVSIFTVSKQVDDGLEDTQVSTDDVVVGTDDVQIFTIDTDEGENENRYLVIETYVGNVANYVFGYFFQDEPDDWQSVTRTDSPAFLRTGNVTAGNAHLRKDVPYLHTYFKYTGLPLDSTDVQSSCLLRSIWNWTSDKGYNKWSTQRQAYRVSNFRTGKELVVTKNRVRGSGHAVSFLFESEPNKTFHIYGWEHNIDATVTD